MKLEVFPPSVYQQRRENLKKKVSNGIILLLGNEDSPMNYKDNAYPFRQDSTFLYFFGLDVARLCAIIDVDNNNEFIFGEEQSIDDVIWSGPLPSLRDMAAQVGVTRTDSPTKIEAVLKQAQASGRAIHWLPPYRTENALKLTEWLSLTFQQVKDKASLTLIHAVISLRSVKEDREIEEIDHAVSMSEDMHTKVIQSTRAGMKEYEVAAKAEEMARALGGRIAYPTILTNQGQILHTHFYGNTLKEGDVVLCDAGAENPKHYAGDLTRTFPVSKRFTETQRDIYNIVLTAHDYAVQLLRPGVKFIDVHLNTCVKLAEGLSAIGLMKGNCQEAVAAGAHTMFFQCGLGHMMGLDVHDMEDLGEEYVGYTASLPKRKEFGVKSLRLGRELETGFVLTIEPGIYIIPELIDRWKAESKHQNFINYSQLKKFRSFGGIRVEDNFVITQTGSRRLGKSLPRTVSEIESMRS